MNINQCKFFSDSSYWPLAYAPNNTAVTRLMTMLSDNMDNTDKSIYLEVESKFFLYFYFILIAFCFLKFILVLK